jgi:hypothetical protein
MVRQWQRAARMRSASAAIAGKTIPSLIVASAVRFVAIAIVEVPIAGRARWFV